MHRISLSTVNPGLKKAYWALTLSSSPAATAYPHAGIQEGIPLVSRLKLNVQSEFVGVGIDRICLHRIFKFLKYRLLTCTPATLVDSNEGRWIVVCL